MEDLESGWKTGPSLPDVAHIATMVEFEGGVVLVGGVVSTILFSIKNNRISIVEFVTKQQSFLLPTS